MVADSVKIEAVIRLSVMTTEKNIWRKQNIHVPNTKKEIHTSFFKKLSPLKRNCSIKWGTLLSHSKGNNRNKNFNKIGRVLK